MRRNTASCAPLCEPPSFRRDTKLGYAFLSFSSLLKKALDLESTLSCIILTRFEKQNHSFHPPLRLWFTFRKRAKEAALHPSI